jgi:hypothetical protein
MVRNERIKRSFSTIQDAIKNCILYNISCTDNKYKYIFRQYKLNSQFTVDKLTNIRLFQMKDGYTDLYNLIYFDKPIKLFFKIYDIHLINVICKYLHLNKHGIIIMKINTGINVAKEYYIVIYTYCYFNNKSDLDKYLVKLKKKYSIEIINERYIPYLTNRNIDVYTGEKLKLITKRTIPFVTSSLINPLILDDLKLFSSETIEHNNIFTITNDELESIISSSFVPSDYIGQKSLLMKDKKTKLQNIIEQEKLNLTVFLDDEINIEKHDKLDNSLSNIYNNFNDALKNITEETYIYKICEYDDNYNVLAYNYICDTPLNLLKLNRLTHKYQIYQYVDRLQPCKLYFYLNDIKLLDKTCEILNIHKNDLFITKDIGYNNLNNYNKIFRSHFDGRESKYNNDYESKTYLIIHKWKYFNSRLDLDMYYFKLNIRKFYINIEMGKYIPYIYNKNISVELIPKLEDNDSIDYSSDEYEYDENMKYTKKKTDKNVDILDNTSNKFVENIDILNYSIINVKLPYDDKTIIKLNKQYVDITDFDKNAEIIFIESSMGSGKSTALVKYINTLEDIENKKILIISSRVTLSNTIYQKFNETNIKFSNYLMLSDSYSKHNKLIISPDSLVKLKQPLNIYDLVWIDESTSLIAYLADYPYEDLRKKLDILFQILYQTKQLILTDANMGKVILEIYTKIKKTENYQYLYYNNYIEKNIIKLDVYTNILKNIIEDLHNNKNIYICSDSKKETVKLFTYFSDYINPDLILLYNGDSPEEYNKYIMNGVNLFWVKYRIVIVSPKVLYGIDFTELHFHKTYGIYKAGGILSTRESLQQMNRIRHLIDKEIIITIVKQQNNLVDDMYSYTYYLEKSYYNRIYLNRRTFDIFEKKIRLNNILKMLKFTYTEDNYRILDRNDPYNLMVIFKDIERNSGLNVSIFQ